MSTYNETKFELCHSIESILNQTYKNIEFIIILDNPNNLEIKEVLTKYKKIDNRIKLSTNERNIGLALSLNRGIDIAKGDYIARMDADDIAHKSRIEETVNYLTKYDFDMVATNRIDIDEENNCYPTKSKLPSNKGIKRLLPNNNFISHPTVLMKADVIKKLNGYRNFKTAQDYDLWLRMLSNGYRIGILDQPFLYYRLRRKGISNSDRYRQHLYTRYIKKLYNQRLRGNNPDSFSETDLESFLTINKYYEKTNRDKFNLAFLNYEQGMMYLKQKRYIRGLVKLSKSILLHREIKKILFGLCKYKIVIRFC